MSSAAKKWLARLAEQELAQSGKWLLKDHAARFINKRIETAEARLTVAEAQLTVAKLQVGRWKARLATYRLASAVVAAVSDRGNGPWNVTRLCEPTEFVRARGSPEIRKEIRKVARWLVKRGVFKRDRRGVLTINEEPTL